MTASELDLVCAWLQTLFAAVDLATERLALLDAVRDGLAPDEVATVAQAADAWRTIRAQAVERIRALYHSVYVLS